MHILISAAALLTAGAVGWALGKRQSDPAEAPQAGDEPAVEEQSAMARVHACTRRMDVLTLTSACDVTFILTDGTALGFHIMGEGSQHLQEGDTGLLTWSEDTFLRFEKDNGEIIGGMFYSPAESEVDADE